MSERTVGLPEIVRTFLKLGALSYGGPAILGILQAEIQEKRQWLSKQRFAEGLSVANMLPGATAVQLGIFIGYDKAGLAGGALAGLCFTLPAFFILLALSMAYAAYGALPWMRDAFHGVGPVVIGIFAMAAYRLGRASIKDFSQVAIAVATALAILATPVGLAATLLAAGCLGVMLFHSRRTGLTALAVVCGAYWALHAIDLSGFWATRQAASAPGLRDLAVFFFKVGSPTSGGGLAMLAFIQEQVVTQLAWLTPQEFVDGLALGQLTPGPVLMLAAFVGFKLAGIAGAITAAVAIFLPSFVMMLTILPLLKRLGELRWLKAFVRGVVPAAIGGLAAALVEMVPHAVPDTFSAFLLIATVAALLLKGVGPLPLVATGAFAGLTARRIPLDSLRELIE